jgi:tRNA dimethylallyltransferase
MAVYRGLDAGTATPTPEERARVPHHLVNVADPGRPSSVAAFQRLAEVAIQGVRARGRRILLVGGSGLYFRAVVDGLAFPGTDRGLRRGLETEAAHVGPAALHARLRSFDPGAAAKIDPRNVRRTVRALEVAALTGRPFSSFTADWERYPRDRVRAAGVAILGEVLRERIEARVRAMVEGGFLEEVRALLDREPPPSASWQPSSTSRQPPSTSWQAIGYAEMARHLSGHVTLEEAIGATVRRTRELARRQMAWFRRDPRIRWFEAGPGGAAGIVDDVTEYLSAGAVDSTERAHAHV